MKNLIALGIVIFSAVSSYAQAEETYLTLQEVNSTFFGQGFDGQAFSLSGSMKKPLKDFPGVYAVTIQAFLKAQNAVGMECIHALSLLPLNTSYKVDLIVEAGTGTAAWALVDNTKIGGVKLVQTNSAKIVGCTIATNRK